MHLTVPEKVAAGVTSIQLPVWYQPLLAVTNMQAVIDSTAALGQNGTRRGSASLATQVEMLYFTRFVTKQEAPGKSLRLLAHPPPYLQARDARGTACSGVANQPARA